jgi:hypothetical protein
VTVVLDAAVGALVPLDAQGFRTFVEDYLTTFSFKMKGEEWVKVRKTMNAETAKGTLASPAFRRGLRPLARVNPVPMPVRRGDGRVELLPVGYDEESQVLTLDPGFEYEEMSGEEARAVLKDLLSEFPIPDRQEDGTSRSEAVVVSAMVANFAALLLPRMAKRLNYAFLANSPASGKTLLAQMCLMPLYGAAEVQGMPESKEEFRKVLDTAALAASPYLFLDDLDGFLKNNLLNAFMTAPSWSGRVMGGQTKFVTPKVTTVFITGNNLELSPDIGRRTLQVELFVSAADPQDRSIARVIDEEFLVLPQTRRQVLSALWALVRSWDGARRPHARKVYRGYEAWSNVFGGIVVHGGFGNPLDQPPKDAGFGDTERQDMETLVAHLVEGAAKSVEYHFDELVDACVRLNCFEYAIDGKEGKDGSFELKPAARAKLGAMFSKRYGGRTFRLPDGRSVVFGSRGKNRHRRYTLAIEA